MSEKPSDASSERASRRRASRIESSDSIDGEPAAKVRMADIVHDQPDDSSYDEILRELAFDRMIQRGLADVASGRTLGDSEIRRRLRLWHGGKPR